MHSGDAPRECKPEAVSAGSSIVTHVKSPTWFEYLCAFGHPNTGIIIVDLWREIPGAIAAGRDSNPMRCVPNTSSNARAAS